MTSTDLAQVAPPTQRVSLVAKIAGRYSVEPARMLTTLKATAFKSNTPVSDEQMMALLIVADQYRLNPFTKEIFAFPDKGGIVPVVSVDGWARIINEHPALDGIDFEYDPAGEFITCILWRKDRTHPIRVTEYLAECRRNTQPWQSHPRRMLRHKALIQCARVAFGFAGIYDEDEAERIIHQGDAVRVEPPSASAARVRAALLAPRPDDDGVIDAPQAQAPAPEPTPAPTPAPANPRALARYMQQVIGASSEEAAALVLDESRDELTPEQQAELHAAFSQKWPAKAAPTTTKETK